MKLKHFKASGVHGYLEFDLQLHEHLTFLVGPNGSGKSTALALLEALITPSLRELALLEFKEAIIKFEDNGAKSISVQRTEDFLSISASWIEEPLKIRNLSSEHREIFANDQEAADEYSANLTLELSANPVFRAISDIAAPVFLGIERQHKKDVRVGAVSNALAGGRSAHSIRVGAAARRLMRGNLAAGLQDTQLIVQEAYRNARRAVDSFQDKLRADVLLSAFEYTDIEKNGHNIFYGDINIDNFQKLNNSRNEITEALSNLGISSDLVNERVGEFFDKLSGLSTRVDAVGKGTPGSEDVILEFLTNRGHVERLQSLISLVQDFKNKSDKSFRRINQFCSSLGLFYEDSGKKISLDQIGRIVVTRSDGRDISLDSLSSGERQLVIIFAHIFFNTYGTRSQVFVIDEPELSLHLRWQEMLVERLTQASPETQFVFATHSPEIVGEFKNRCVQV